MIETFRDDILSTLTPGELDFLYFAELHLGEIAGWGIEEAAGASYASTAVIERACKKLRLSGYAELRFLVKSELEGRTLSAQDGVSDYGAEAAQDALLREASLTFRNAPPPPLSQAAAIVWQAHSLVIFGRGLSEFPAEYLSEYLTRIGRPCRRYLDPPFAYRDASAFTERDAMVIFSSGGRTIPVIKAAAIARKNKASVIGICSDRESPLWKMADIALHAASDRLTISQIDLNSRFTEFSIADALVDELLRRRADGSSAPGPS
jgi:DNA-binding MurR/RpiR family transcriptional regulator